MSTDKKLFKLKIKRLFSQFEYLDSELIETQYLFDQYNEKFKGDCLKDNYKPPDETKPENTEPGSNIEPYTQSEKEGHQKTDANEEEKVDADIEADVDIEADDDNNVLKSLRKLYKLLCLKTHPDKRNGDKESFQEVREAFISKNIARMLILASRFDIDITDFLEDDIIVSFEVSINDIKKKIDNYRITLAWRWNFANDDEKNMYKKMYNI